MAIGSFRTNEIIITIQTFSYPSTLRSSQFFTIRTNASPILGCSSDLYLPQLGDPAVTEYKITVARIETDARDAQEKEICVTFQVERTPISFQIPIFINAHDFDDTEMIQVARNILHRIFMQLAAECRDWKLTTAELQRLSKLNLRPRKLPA